MEITQSEDQKETQKREQFKETLKQNQTYWLYNIGAQKEERERNMVKCI